MAPGGTDAARVMDDLRRLVRVLRIGSSDIQRSTGISSAQLFTLRQISRRTGQSLSELAASTLTTQSSVSEVVSKLVRRGLATRESSPDDRRRAELQVTAAGYKVLETAPETPQEKLLAGLVAMGPARQRHLAAGLEEWLKAAGLDNLPPTMFFEGET
ncbi:MAG TPA: MarR family transcriptional regulator [Gemmatimonadaceae bacterium]|nr:MarR family transcriptional regulator [Gemmatimonadaceae bacterium]